MTNPDYTAIMILIDRSGSMIEIQKSAEDGVNEFIEAQAKTDNYKTIRIAQFDHDYELVCESKNPACGMEPYKLVPRASTALLDAMGRAINEFGAELEAMPEDERPGTVIFAVVTDGEENSSREFSWDAVKVMVKHQEEVYGWQVIYLAANQDAFKVGSRLGVNRGRTMSYNSTDHGTRAVYDAFSASVAASASTGERVTFTEEDQERVAGTK